MKHRCVRVGVGSLLAVAGMAWAQPLPPNFADQQVIAGWNQAVGLAFASDGRGFVWEKAGRVWLVENGVKASQPLIDIREEVANWGDYGLIGFAIDPNFYSNGHIYLFYAVDHYYLVNFGLPGYNPNTSTNFHDTIGRITRYTCNAAGGYRTVNLASRLILVGETITTGFPLLHDSHGIGTIGFGEDGSLMAGCGDGSTYVGVNVGGNANGSSNTGLADGIITATENVGAYRAQLVNSLSGKIIRIDPATGDGLASNPFYDIAAPRAPRSRVWTVGTRNPFRWSVRPGTGAPKIAAGDPGTLYIGDVGMDTHERLDVAPTGGLNFGWPAFEGFDVHQGYWNASPQNLDAPNPLAGGSCPAFFKFTNLIVPSITGTPSWPNPCNTAQQVPATIPRFMMRPGAVEWGHAHPVRVPRYVGGALSPVAIDNAASPVQGFQFGGACASATMWYPGTAFPATYQNTFFIADYVGQYILNCVFDASDNLVQIRPFATDAGGVVALAYNPADGAMYYINYSDTGSALRKIFWTNNLPPTAVADATPRFGAMPLTVNFSSAGSTDPENQPLSYLWNFGDGSPPSTLANPTHLYQTAEDITALGTFTARVLSLVPPHPTGEGNQNPQVIRDGITPLVGSDNPQTQYDTSHDGAQGNDDWIGYTFASDREIRWINFQEGMEFGSYGGWFNTLNVEYRTGTTWTPVTGLTAYPEYPGTNAVNFESFKLGFNPVMANGIRLRGQGGGVNKFISVGELRVFATPLSQNTTPTAHTATLTVTDAAFNSVSTNLLISPNNTPPQVTITSPVDGSQYTVGPDIFVQLRADIADAETPGQTTCQWQAIFHHNTHTHPEPALNTCAPDITVPSGGCDEVYFWEFRLTVTDPQGLTTVRSVSIFPNCSCYPNCDGSSLAPLLNANDFQCYLNKFASGDEHYANCDGSSVAPVLNANDFQCYLNAFAAGCS